MASGHRGTAVVTGASRGIGRAIAISLGEIGFTVYVTARSRRAGGVREGTVDQVAQEVTVAGGHGIGVACDHRDDLQVEALFERIDDGGSGLDLLVNNVFPTDSVDPHEEKPFYDQPVGAIDDLLPVGLRAHYVATWHAVQRLRRARKGLVVNISAASAVFSVLAPAYCLTKTALDKFTIDGARQLKRLDITMLSLWPGPWVGTDKVLATLPGNSAEGTESPFITGLAVAALARDENVSRYTGRVLVAADVVAAHGLSGPDGEVPGYPFDDEQVQRQLLRRAPVRLTS